MLDRLLFWLVVLTPILIVIGAALHKRWKDLAPQRRSREMVIALVVFGGGLTSFLAWDLFSSGRAETSRLHFQNPHILLGLIPVFGLVLLLQWKSLAGLSGGRMWFSFLIRSAVIILLALALAGLQMVIEKDILTVIFALDRSKSVSVREAERALGFINKTLPSKPADDRVGLLVFGGKAATETWPKVTFRAPKVRELHAEVQNDATNIAEGMKRALATFEENTGKRLVVFTDGRQTTGNAYEELKRLKAQGVDVFIVPLRRDDFAEMLIDSIKVEPKLRWEQEFSPRVFVFSNVNTRARVTLFTGDKRGPAAYQQDVDLKAGQRTAVVFRNLKYKTPGYKQLKAVIEPLEKDADTLSQNNSAYAFTDVDADSRVLVITSDLEEVKHLVRTLETEKLALDVRSGATLPENPEAYRRYDCIVLVNLARSFLGEQQMAVIESCVRDQGAGLVMIGGDQSFGAGGYLGTPIERALPVTMDLRNQRVMPSGALAIVLHTCEFGNGAAWGRKIAKAAINVLSPQDYAGVLYYGGFAGEKWLFRPTRVSRKRWMFKMIDGAMTGDMPDLNKIVSMGVNGLRRLKRVSLKHCIIITDGDPNPPSARTIAAAKNGKISITVITIFPHGGPGSVQAMKSLATQTGGRYYSPNDPKKLPLIFIKEAAIVRKNLIYQDEKGIPISLGTPGEILREFGKNFPKVRAFVVTNAKSRAEMHLYTVVEGDKVPLLARWRYGLGKSVAFTSDATNRWAKDWVEWPSYEKFWTNVFHWVCRQRMPSNHNITTTIKDGKGHVMVEAFDGKGNYVNFAKLIGVASEPGKGVDLDAASHSLKFSMTQPGRYEATFPVAKPGAYTVTLTDVSNPNRPSSIVTGLSNSYSDEFRYLEPDEALLNKLGNLAGDGKTSRLQDLREWDQEPLKTGLYNHNLPPVQDPTDLFWPLLLAALCLFPLDVAVRRLHIDPTGVFVWIGDRLSPLFGFLRAKKEEVADAVAEAARTSAGEQVPPPPLVPTGEESRAAQSRYEEAGDSSAARDMDLRPQDQPGRQPKAVGGKKLSQVDEAASDYTRALLKAKKRARKKDS